MTENYDGFGGSGIFFAFLIFALFAFGGNGGAWGWGAPWAELNFKETYDGMVRSDYYKDGQAPQYYADLAFDFLEDKDAPEGKAKRYYLAMHCAE